MKKKLNINNNNYFDHFKEKFIYLKEELKKNKNFLYNKKNNLLNNENNEEKKINNLKIKNENKNNIEKIEKEFDFLNYLKSIENLEKEINFLLEENIKLKEEKLIVLADGENLKRRLSEEKLNIKKYRSFFIAEKLLPALDNFERALQINNISSEVKNFLIGFEMIFKLIKTAFNEENIIEIDVKIGDKFDPNIHSALEVVKNENIESEKIVKIIQKGYKIYDRVLRHASVIISE